MKLYFVRHGQTIGNVRGALDTELPGPPLTPLGQEQAEALVETLHDHPIVAIYASEAIRAQETAAPLARALGYDVQVVEGVKEVGAGDLEGRADVEAVQAYMGVVHQWTRGDLTPALPGGESGAQVRERMLSAVGELRAKHEQTDPEGVIVLVSHGGAIRLAAEWLAANVGAEIADKGIIPNTGIVVLESLTEGGWHCHSWAGFAL